MGVKKLASEKILKMKEEEVKKLALESSEYATQSLTAIGNVSLYSNKFTIPESIVLFRTNSSTYSPSSYLNNPFDSGALQSILTALSTTEADACNVS